MTDIAITDVVRRRDHLLANELNAAEAVMLDVDRGTYYGMQDVSKVIWEQLAEPVQVEELIARLLDRYEVEPETCRTEVVAYLEELRQQELILVQGG